MKRLGNLSFNYFKEPLIEIFQKDAPYGSISLFVRHTKGIPSVKMVYKK